MEVSVIGSSQVKIDVGLCNLSKNLNVNLKNGNLKGLSFGESGNFVKLSKSAIGFRLRTSVFSQIQAVVVSDSKDSKFTQTKNNDKVKQFVGMPLDTVSNCNTITHKKAIAAGLKALKLLGVDGVELPIWWGAVERESMGQYDWSSYLAIVDMVRSLGLKLHVSLCFHASSEAKMQLPQWVSQIGESVPDIYFTDVSGNRYKDCLSLSVDDLPVLHGKTPLDVYRGFCESFKASFLPFMGSTITGVSIGLGPDGELRYPSHHTPSKTKTHTGAGEFQCYDKNMLDKLRTYAETHGNPLWGRGGPHDAPTYDRSPLSNGFFTNGGSWETPYGDFFLSWYSSELIRHGDQMLSLAASTFKDAPVALSSKIPLMHTWYNTPSHPAELTAGFYNTANRDGYDAISKIFLKHSCKMVVPGMDLSDQDIPNNLQSSPESLLAQIMSSCREHGIEVSGQNSLVSGSLRGFDQIKDNLLRGNARVGMFTYQRMGADFFSPNHFRSFAQFFSRLHQPNLSLDDLPVEKENSDLHSGSELNMQPVV